MKTLPKVFHLVDDTTAGGVMRVLDFLHSDHNLAETALHEVKSVNRGKIINNLGKADVIVSHLAISWRSLPSLIALRALYVRTPLVHVEHSYTCLLYPFDAADDPLGVPLAARLFTN